MQVGTHTFQGQMITVSQHKKENVFFANITRRHLTAKLILMMTVIKFL